MYRDWFEKPVEAISETEVIGIRAVDSEMVKLLARIYRVHADKIITQVYNRSVHPWQLDFDRFTGLSMEGEYQIGYVGSVPSSISHNQDMVIGYMNGRRRRS